MNCTFFFSDTKNREKNKKRKERSTGTREREGEREREMSERTQKKKTERKNKCATRVEGDAPLDVGHLARSDETACLFRGRCDTFSRAAYVFTQSCTASVHEHVFPIVSVDLGLKRP